MIVIARDESDEARQTLTHEIAAESLEEAKAIAEGLVEYAFNDGKSDGKSFILSIDEIGMKAIKRKP